MASLLEHLEAAGEQCTPALRSAFLALEARVAELEALVRSQAEEIRELKRQLRRHSGNSSLPPSSDPPHLKQSKTKPSRDRRRGAQPGHDPHQRSLLSEGRVDAWVDHYPTTCRHCGQRLERPREVGLPERRQVIELPEIRARVIEHRLHRLRCAQCRRITPGIAPAAVPGSVSFGARLVAFSAMLTVRLRASRRGLRKVLADLLDVEPPCVGELQQLLEEASAATLPAYQEVRSALRSSAAAGWTRRVGSCGAAPTGSRRASPARSLAERVGLWGEAEAQRLFALWHRFRAGDFDRAELRRRLQPLKARVRRFLEHGARCGVRRVEKSSKQLLGLWPALWSFAVHPGVEPTNNEAERALRAGVIWRKTSFGSQSGRGLRLIERLLTVAETAKKQKRDLLDYLAAAIEAHRTGTLPPVLIATP